MGSQQCTIGHYPEAVTHHICTQQTRTINILLLSIFLIVRPSNTRNVLWRNSEARSRNRCCSGKTMSITQTECVFVFVALSTQHAMRMRHIAICGLPRSTIFFPHYLAKGTIFGGKKVVECKTCVSSFWTNCIWKMFHCKKNWARCDQMCVGLHVKCRYHCEVWRSGGRASWYILIIKMGEAGLGYTDIEVTPSVPVACWWRHSTRAMYRTSVTLF